MFVDIGFSRDSKYCFQLCIDDFDRVGYLQNLKSKDEALSKWMALKDHLEVDKFPLKFAFIKSDSEPLQCTQAWRDHAEKETWFTNIVINTAMIKMEW